MQQIFLSIIFSFQFVCIFAQIKPIRSNLPVSKEQTPEKVNPITKSLPGIHFQKNDFRYLSKLDFAYNSHDPDCKSASCYFWEYSTSITKYASPSFGTKDWKESLMWRKIPKEAAYGRYEISFYPFSEDNSAIIQSGIIETKGIDSVFFDIDYKAPPIMPSVSPFPKAANSRSDKPTVFTNIVSNKISKIPIRNTKPTFESATNSGVIYQKMIDGYERNYYIRMVALNSKKAEINNTSTEVIINAHLAKEWKYTPPPDAGPRIFDDYTITKLEYIPAHFGLDQYRGCVTVTGYNESAFGSSQFGSDFANSFKNAYPIGSKICPTPPEDKAWYEKAFNTATDIIKKTINGAADYYNKTKTYLKDKFKEFNCNADGTIAIVNPTSKLQQMAGPEVCEQLSGAAFDYGMAAVGLPPTIPNVDDLTKMAEGQIVDLALDKLEEETGVPVPDELKDKIKKEFHDKMDEQYKAGTIDAGFLRVKPHHYSMFETAYLRIEVTRTGNSFSKKAIAGFSISNFCERPGTYCETCNTTNPKHIAAYNLYEDTYTQVPFLANVGDKKTLIVVLKPKESWLHHGNSIYEDNSGIINRIDYSPPKGIYYTPVISNNYESITNSTGWKLLFTKTTINFKVGLKTTAGLNTTFYNK